jgi:hypothetical protein
MRSSSRRLVAIFPKWKRRGYVINEAVRKKMQNERK